MADHGCGAEAGEGFYHDPYRIQRHGHFGVDVPTACQGSTVEVVLYLLESGLFLLINYGFGYQQDATAGHWQLCEEKVQLRGVHKVLMTDYPVLDTCRWFAEGLPVGEEDGAPVLGFDVIEGTRESGFSKRFHYLGRRHVVCLDSSFFPNDLNEIDAWIRDFLAKNDPDNQDEDYLLRPSGERMRLHRINLHRGDKDVPDEKI
ncbi:MAG: hypothetical protein ACYC5A_09615 [Thermoleophilia bacterium]